MACGLTHWAVTPLDLVKCRRQVDTKMYKGNMDGWRKIIAADVSQSETIILVFN